MYIYLTIISKNLVLFEIDKIYTNKKIILLKNKVYNNCIFNFLKYKNKIFDLHHRITNIESNKFSLEYKNQNQPPNHIAQKYWLLIKKNILIAQ